MNKMAIAAASIVLALGLAGCGSTSPKHEELVELKNNGSCVAGTDKDSNNLKICKIEVDDGALLSCVIFDGLYGGAPDCDWDHIEVTK